VRLGGFEAHVPFAFNRRVSVGGKDLPSVGDVASPGERMAERERSRRGIRSLENLSRDKMKRLIRQSLRAQGFNVRGDRLTPPRFVDKDSVRAVHSLAVRHQVDRAREGLRSAEDRLLGRIASGEDINPLSVRPRLKRVISGTDDELLFRYARLHWSIPTSKGYGRRLRFLVEDQQNGKLMGIIGLDDPIYHLPARDRWIGWSAEAHRDNLSRVMDAYLLGAVPPYSQLLAGKLVAMLAASNEVRAEFAATYGGHRAKIRRRLLPGELALITTTSALGRSSIYDRVRYEDRLLFQPIGFTQGWGEFHFSNGVSEAISIYAHHHCKPTAKHSRWGPGFRNRREMLIKTFGSIGLPKHWLRHGVEREVFAVPLGQNCQEFLRGESERLESFDLPASKLSEFYLQRWLVPRSQRDTSYSAWDSGTWRLWSG
jgi:hypothetical protein